MGLVENSIKLFHKRKTGGTLSKVVNLHRTPQTLQEVMVHPLSLPSLLQARCDVAAPWERSH